MDVRARVAAPRAGHSRLLMDTQRWRQMQDLFAEASALHGDARERFLREHEQADAEVVEQVRSLLAADSQTGILDAPVFRVRSVAKLVNDAVPDRIGPYRIVREIGRGGMGVVYHAERADGQFHQRVAIKLIGTPDADDPLHKRFLDERQILAGLVHPHIARLLDGGILDDGRPYLVMEYVDGLPITTFCDRNRLDVRARLRLFVDVCAAVQHAHQNLVVHRDLKPSNILVSNDGRVHLLDFGIAKLMNPALSRAQSPVTQQETRALTPEYASPEQIRGDTLTTASDTYSLGVLLYELLSGRQPYRLTTGSPHEVATAVCEQDPERPSTRAADNPHGEAEARSTTPDRLVRQLSGDLDSIVLMAMRKEPQRRYASADMLRQDIERHLSGLQVDAHRGSTRYRIGKFVRRHRVETAAASIVLVALVTGLTVAIGQSRRASRERDRAEQALIESEGVTNFLLDLFRTGDPGDPPPAELSAIDLLRRGALRANDLANQPVAHARLLDVIGQMSLHLGRWEEAERRLEQAVAIRRSTADAELDLASSLIHLGWVYRARGDNVRARPLAEEALTIRQRVLPANHADVGEALYELGRLSGGLPQERLYREALAILPDSGALAERRVTTLLALSTNLRRQGRLEEALSGGREALRAAQRVYGPDHYVAGDAMVHLGDHVYHIEHDTAAAEQLYRNGLLLLTQRFGENSIRLVHGLNSLATLLGERGDASAEQLLRRALAIRQSATGPEHPGVAEQNHRLAAELARQGNTREAEALAQQALEVSKRTLGETHPVIAQARMPLFAEVYDRAGRYQDADRIYLAALSQSYPTGVVAGEMRRIYGRMLLRRGEFSRAEEQLLKSFELLKEVYRGTTHPNVQESSRALMELYQKWGKADLVEKYRVPGGRYVPY